MWEFWCLGLDPALQNSITGLPQNLKTLFCWGYFAQNHSTVKKLKRCEAGTGRGARVPTAVLQVVILNCSPSANEETRCYLPFGAATVIRPSQTSPVPTSTPGQLPGF